MTTPHPLVAIVTPVYNGAAYLRETMACVQAQTYANIVHIVLDNASTDDTPAIIAAYDGQAKPVVAARNETLLPATKNWNAAVRLIPPEAKYFRVLCADDVIDPRFIERTVAVFEQNANIGLVGCQLHINDDPPFPTRRPTDQTVFSGQDVLREYFKSECWTWIPTGHVLYRCADLATQTPFFPENLILNDLGASMEVLMHGDMGFVHEDLGMTRMHAENQTNMVVRPRRMSLCEGYYLAVKYCPRLFDKAEAENVIAPFRRFYLRQLLRWRMNAPDIYAAHEKRLNELGVKIPLHHYLDALLDYPLARFHWRPTWDGYYLERPPKIVAA